jgi:hypothetical protein
MNSPRKRIRVRSAAEKRERTLRLQSRVPLAIPRPSEMTVTRKSRYVDGHEAVELDMAGEKAQRIRLARDRAHGICEGGCGTSLMLGAHRHHWKGRGRGERCDCDWHIQILCVRCHDNAHRGRLGAPYRSKP